MELQFLDGILCVHRSISGNSSFTRNICGSLVTLALPFDRGPADRPHQKSSESFKRQRRRVSFSWRIAKEIEYVNSLCRLEMKSDWFAVDSTFVK